MSALVQALIDPNNMGMSEADYGGFGSTGKKLKEGLLAQLLMEPVRKTAGLVNAAKDSANEQFPLQSGVTEQSTDYDPRRVAAEFGAETALNLVGGPSITGGVPVDALGSAAARMSRNGMIETQGIRAYHGSPHDFDRFDLSKIGTGEGAQAYGHGLYFADNPKVAESYKKDVTMMMHRNNPGWTPVQEEAATRFYATGQDHKAAIKDIADRIKDSRMYGDSPASLRQLNEAHDLLRSGWKPPGGKMYEVNINAKPEQFLDWDKPLAQQGQHIDQSIYDVLGSSGVSSKAEINHILNTKTGQDAVRRMAKPSYPVRDDPALPWRASGATSLDEALAMVGGDKRRVNTLLTPDPAYTSEALKAAGIPGIKYLDQGSSNSVVFDDNLIEILRKYGLLGPVAGAAVAGADQTQQ